MITSRATSDNEWQQMTTSDNEWQRVTVTTSDNEWYSEWELLIQRVITNDNEWQRVIQRMKTNENDWEQVKESNFGFRMKQNMQCTTTIYSGM